jgi:hypothetical protein
MRFTLKPKKYVTNRRGQKVGLVLNIEDYRKMLEELESIRVYDSAKASCEGAISFLKDTQDIGR